MDVPSPRFVALQPDERLTELLWRYKERTRELVGPQMYLDHPPHLTVYLAVFPAGADLSTPIGELAESLTPPRVRLLGWHVFESDPLTGLHTLVCEIHPEDKEQLRRVQARVVESVAPRRDRAATEARFGPRLSQLTEEQRANVAGSGFPYLGAGWVPHFTVASVEPANWDRLYGELKSDPPAGEFACSHLREYELIDGHPNEVATFTL